MVDNALVGEYIASLRKSKGLTQNDLGERLNVSYQAVSKWERGETLPDIGVLLDLANVLETTVDGILTGGKGTDVKRKVTVAQVREAIESIDKLGELLGRDNIFYTAAIEGISEAVHMDFEKHYAESYTKEALIAVALIQTFESGAYVDLSEVKREFRHKYWSDVVCEFAARYNIK